LREGTFILDLGGLRDLGREIAADLDPGDRVFLEGGLGSGKSTLARAVLKALGVRGAIPSPSYIMDAVYDLPRMQVHHMDLYRLSGEPDELSMLGFDEILDSDAVVIVEWADRILGVGLMPGYHVRLRCVSDPTVREVAVARRLAGN
jgi:tRNA threonylcarbamoyl adenosine modification protein YjeE